jgi:predicted lipoprotein with Yx(FWY)xxD motif
VPRHRPVIEYGREYAFALTPSERREGIEHFDQFERWFPGWQSSEFREIPWRGDRASRSSRTATLPYRIRIYVELTRADVKIRDMGLGWDDLAPRTAVLWLSFTYFRGSQAGRAGRNCRMAKIGRLLRLNAAVSKTSPHTGECQEDSLDAILSPSSSVVRTAANIREPEETNDMEQTKQHRETTHRLPVGRIAAAAFAVGGLSALVFAVSTAGATTSAAAKSVVVSTVQSAKFGKVLASGKTLYTLKGSKTACTAECVKIWPELLLPKGVTKATAGTGASVSKLGTIMRTGGVRQVTYDGKALYWFSGDTAAGQVNGNVTDTWGKWSSVATGKHAASSSSSGSGSGGSSSGSGGAGF